MMSRFYGPLGDGFGLVSINQNAEWCTLELGAIIEYHDGYGCRFGDEPMVRRGVIVEKVVRLACDPPTVDFRLEAVDG